MNWLLLHPRMTPEHLGLIPSFLREEDPRPAREQIKERYVAGWSPMKGFSYDPETLILTYPGDPPMKPLASTILRKEIILFYPHDWLLIIQQDGSWEIARLD